MRIWLLASIGLVLLSRFTLAAEPTGGLLMPAPVDRRRFLGLELSPKALTGTSGLIVASGPLSAPARLAA